MYTIYNYRSKKALKEAVRDGIQVTVYQPGPFGGREPEEGWITLEGPHFPKPHTWYARALLANGCVVKVT